MTSQIVPTGLVPTFHDGYLTGIVLADGAAILSLTDYAGQNYDLTLLGLEGLKADNFLENNIVLHLEIVCATTPYWINVEDQLRQLMPPYGDKVASEFHIAHAERQAKNLARIASGDAALVVIESTMGCDLIALCRSYELAGRT